MNIEELKQEHGEIIELTSEDGKKCYLKKPSRAVVSFAMTLQAQGKILEVIEHLIKNCYVAGDTCFYEDTDYMLGASGVLEKLIKAKQVEIKNY